MGFLTKRDRLCVAGKIREILSFRSERKKGGGPIGRRKQVSVEHFRRVPMNAVALPLMRAMPATRHFG
jgi:hypothetical protein